jgi:hypothetical protein
MRSRKGERLPRDSNVNVKRVSKDKRGGKFFYLLIAFTGDSLFHDQWRVG